ncbi:MAG: aminoacetone oxidase family FAD-binding enzyme, partial [Pyrinomonadaceae bacterium]|nr:aminoacetone oxidase family FAD-binding enzyme [Pyrinomonadaceae bacterium]
QIVDMLLAECRAARVRVETGCTVSSVEKGDGFTVDTSRGKFTAASLVIATGGLSFPKIGATDIGYRIAKQFGLKIEPTRPSLVPLVFSSGKELGKLAGISVDTEVTADGHSFRENILFTHRGLSGPAILQASNYWHADKPLGIDLAPERDIAALLAKNAHSKKLLPNFLSEMLPNRLVEAFAANGLPNKPLDRLSGKEIESIGRTINDWRVGFKETEGWHKAEVTLGGVSTAELSSQTMEAKKIPGLFFIGEVVDVTGWLGGYNFQWAWSSGYAAGQYI